jgi:hypothetical protein
MRRDLHTLQKIFLDDDVKEDEMGETCSTNGRDEKFIHSFDREI